MFHCMCFLHVLHRTVHIASFYVLKLILHDASLHLLNATEHDILFYLSNTTVYNASLHLLHPEVHNALFNFFVAFITRHSTCCFVYCVHCIYYIAQHVTFHLMR